MHRNPWWLACILPLLRSLPVAAQPVDAPPYRVVPTTSTSRAIHYPFLRGSTLLGFQGTALGPDASGQASLRAVDGRMRIHAHFRGLEPASRLGPEYLTYVLWAISPQGRATNLGEVVVKGGRAHVEARTGLQTFALVVTAEPYYAVTRVSGALVLENRPPRGSRLGVEAVETRFEPLAQGAYVLQETAAVSGQDARVSPYVFQARNALRIAQAEQADTLAPEAYHQAQAHLERMEDQRRLGARPAVLLARQAIEQAEDARLEAGVRRAAQVLAQERDRAEEAQAQTEAARSLAESARARAAQEALKASRQEREASEVVRKATEAQLEARRKLLSQLNRLLRTRETAQGLQATLAEVAFPSGRSLLSPSARVNLAKVAGILLARPGLRITVQGHTDAQGSATFNERLSRERAEAVRAFLLRQGLPGEAIRAEGLSGAHPVASNATAPGRRQNRRVELLVSGEAIGW